MSAGVGPTFERPGAPRPAPNPSQNPQTARALRLPEERAFEVATINRRLACMAQKAAPGLKS